jgi:hypothetical protein
METKKFVMTYGTSASFPYEGGYSLVYARNMETARAMHAKKYGYTKDGYLRFAFSYTAEESRKFGCETGQLHSILTPCNGGPDNVIDDRAKKIIDRLIDDNKAAGLIDAVEDILDVVAITAPDTHREAIRDLLDVLKDDLDYWLAKEPSECIDDLEELVYIQRKVDTVQVYYDNIDEIGDVKECSIRDLIGEITHFAGGKI